MSLEAKTRVEIDGMELPAYLLENFEKAERNLRATYGRSPAVPDLLRLWIANATSWGIQADFERTVLDVKRSTAQPNKEGVFDEDSFEM
ncbi:MAG TPA: hypothetical protein VFB27_04735 [Opitutaceae bacterium]|nr:hypothetical protein [Opitutaceae bacterium]